MASNVGQVYYRVLDKNSGGYISNITLFSSSTSGETSIDLVSNQGNDFTKVGVQAPPGTQIVFNGSKTIMVGRTGVYELDEDITITSMYFVHPKNYVKDEEQSEKLIKEGSTLMAEAEDKREADMYELNVGGGYEDANGNILKEKDTAYWNGYNDIQTAYIESYYAGLDTYNRGVNGYYIQSGYKDLENVIVDYTY